MLSKLAGIAIVALSVGLLLATPAAQAKTKTVKGTFNVRGESATIFSSFSFDGSKVNDAFLSTFSSTVTFPKDLGLNDSATGQIVSEYSVDISAPCSFTGVFGEHEPAKGSDVTATLTLVGFAGAVNGTETGSTFAMAKTATGCEDLTNGTFTITQTDSLFGGPKPV